jgi:serine/threonine-protein kinase
MDADGGDAVQITELDLSRGDEYHAWPEALPDGEHVLLTVATGESSEIAVLSLETEEWHIVDGLRGAAQPRYLDAGYLVFYRFGALFAAPFSLSSLSLTGPEILVLDSLLTGEMAGLEIGYFAASGSGVLAYIPDAGSGVNHIVMVDRQGKETLAPMEPGNYRYGMSLSPDGQRLAAGVQRERGSVDIWVLDLSRGTRTRLTSQGSNIEPIWSVDGTSIFYAAFPSGSFDVYQVRADGGRAPEPILTGNAEQHPTALSRDGALLVVEEIHPNTGNDLHLVTLDGAPTNRPFLSTSANERSGRISPDDRFLAYVSDESGRNEVYVRMISGDGGKTPISTSGGESPRWSPRGDELFYWRGSVMMRVSVQLESSFRASQPEVLFEGRYRGAYDVTDDGRHFIMVTRAHPELTELNVTLNWAEELKRLVPTE